MSDIQTWDAGGTWDSGLQWDVNVGPSLGDIEPYLDLVTSEHRNKPNFIAALSAVLQPIADLEVLLRSMPDLYDLDLAVGSQLDVVGLWVGVSRFLSEPLTGVYFSFGIDGVGFGQGTWFGPFDPVSGLVALPDPAYRTLLRARIASNQWDGTIPGAYAAWDILFAGTGYNILIQDNENMSMLFALLGPAPDAVTLALLTGGYLTLKPAGVRVVSYVIPSVPNTPLFGFGVENTSIAGFGVGSFGTFIAP